MRTAVAALLVAALLAISAMPSFAWEWNWGNGFEDWPDGWNVSGTAGPTTSRVRTGDYALSSGAGSYVWQDLRGLAGTQIPYRAGLAEAWIWDDMSTTDFYLALYSRDGISTANRVAAVGNRPITPTPSYYHMFWSYSSALLDGMSAPSYAGTTWTVGPAAPRALGWHRFRLTWSFDYALGEGSVRYYVDDVANPKMTMNINDTCTRWGSTNNVAYLVLGSGYYDDVVFGGDLAPEPPPLIALGGGLAGLAGIARRRKIR